MTAALRTLLTNIIDYAGLFPPAALPLDAAIHNYADYLKSPDRWMLARFICPAARLHELKPYLDELFTNALEPLTVSTLARGGKDPIDLIANLEADLAEVKSLRAVAGDRAKLDAVEIRAFADPAQNGEVLDHISGRLNDLELRGFLEVPWMPDDRQSVRDNACAFAERKLGFKLRTGGTEAAAFPTSNTIARAIIACRDAKCALKFTAGLHHPIRAFHQSVNTTMHGFINAFAAGVLAHTHGMDEHGVAEILNTEAAADFSFDEYGLRWKTLNATRQRIEQVRTGGLISFGSCSFDEPREDLRTLGWM